MVRVRERFPGTAETPAETTGAKVVRVRASLPIVADFGLTIVGANVVSERALTPTDGRSEGRGCEAEFAGDYQPGRRDGWGEGRGRQGGGAGCRGDGARGNALEHQGVFSSDFGPVTGRGDH